MTANSEQSRYADRGAATHATDEPEDPNGPIGRSKIRSLLYVRETRVDRLAAEGTRPRSGTLSNQRACLMSTTSRNKTKPSRPASCEGGETRQTSWREYV